MTVGPGSVGTPSWREARRAGLGRPAGSSTARAAVVGTLIAVVLMGVVALLDYHLNQPLHRVAMVLLAASLGVGILIKPLVGLFIFPVLAPFLPWIPPVPVPGINAINLLLGGVFTTWAISRAISHQTIFRPARLGVLILCLLGLAALSIVRGGAFPTGYTYDAMASSVELFRSTVTLGVYFVALSMVRGPRDRKWFAWAIVLGLLAEAAITIAYGRTGRGSRAVGSIGQSNDLGTFLAIYSVFAAALLPGVRNIFGKLVLVAGVLLGGYATVLSVSRAAIVAFGIGLLYVGLRSSKVLTLVLIVGAITSPLWAPDYLKERMLGTQKAVEGTDEAELESGAQERVDTWRALATLVEDHPLDGVGFSGLEYVLPQTGEELGLEVKDSSHNTYLRTLAEMGIFGLMLFCLLLWNCWRLGSDAARASVSRFDRQIGVGVAGATVALALSCAFGDRFFNPVISSGFWIACALANDILIERREASP